MPTFILRIYLIGLVALVPQFQGPNSLTIVLPATACQHQHEPALVYSKPSTDPNGLASSSVKCETVAAGIDDCAVLLDGVDVEVATPRPPSARHQLEFTATREPHDDDFTGALPQTSFEASSFDWIPRLQAISVDHATLGPKILSSQDKSVVAAVLKLAPISGKVSSFGLSAAQDGQIPVVKFERNARSVLQQALAETAVVEVEVQGDSVTLSLRSFGSASTTSQVLKPDATGVVAIVLANLQLAKTEQEDHFNHFNLYYGVTTDPSFALPVDDPAVTTKRLQGGGINPQVPPILEKAKELVLKLGGDPPGICTINFESRQLCTLAVVEPPKP